MDDSQRFDDIYRRHHRAVLAYCARRSSRSDAWDATSEVFVVAWRRLSDVPDDNPLPWLIGVAHRVLANQRRGTRRRIGLTQRIKTSARPEDVPSPENQLVRHEEERQVIAALAKLPELDREIITLALWDELDRNDIAMALGLKRNTVDKRLERAKKRLANEFTATDSLRSATQPAYEQGGSA